MCLGVQYDYVFNLTRFNKFVFHTADFLVYSKLGSSTTFHRS